MPLTPVSCEAQFPAEIPSCSELHDGLETDVPPSQDTINITCTPGGGSSFCDYSGGCAANGCISNLWLRFDMGAQAMVSHVRFMAGWWNERPDNYEIWASDATTDVPGSGATLVHSAVADSKPWRCVTGETCTFDTPDACCPNGRDNPQDTTVHSLGTFFPKFTGEPITPTTARYWYLVIVDSDQDYQANMKEVEFLGPQCP